jgi:hypothetical protein
MKVRRWLSLGAVAMVTLGIMTAAGARPESRKVQPDTASAQRSVTQQSCFQSGSGATFFRPCVSTHGNMYRSEAPSGAQHIFGGNEGYGICSNTGFVYDAGATEAGFGAQTVSQPGGVNTFPLSIARSGGGWRVTQTYARDATQREFNITVAVRNTTTTAKTDVYIARFFDGDLDGDAGDDVYLDTADAVIGRDLRGLALQAVSLGTSHDAIAQSHANYALGVASGNCNWTPVTTPATGDYTGLAYYYFPSVAAGTTKTVKFTYRVM